MKLPELRQHKPSAAATSMDSVQEDIPKNCDGIYDYIVDDMEDTEE